MSNKGKDSGRTAVNKKEKASGSKDAKGKASSGKRGGKVATIGYEGVTPDAFLAELKKAGVQLLVDVRAVSSSRRPGFSKTRLAENLAGVGIDYLHLRGLGTPADGRAAAHAGRHEEMRRIYLEHLETPEAQTELDTLTEIVASGTRACLLCFEANPEHCHRTIIVERLKERMKLEVTHLAVDGGKED